MRRIARPIVLLSVLWWGAVVPPAHAQVIKAEADARRARGFAEQEETRRAAREAVRKAAANQVAAREVVIRRPGINIRVPVFGRGEFQNLEFLARGHLTQYRPILTDEYLFARRVCALTPEERKEIALEGERALRAAVLDLATYNITQRFLGSTSPPQPLRVIREALAKALKGRLSAERWQAYECALKERDAEYLRSIVNHLVAHLDGELLLSPAQREETREILSRRLEARWREQSDTPAGPKDGSILSAPAAVADPFELALTDPQREYLAKSPQAILSTGPTGLTVRLLAEGPHQLRMAVSLVGNINQAMGGNGNGGGAAIEIEELVEAEKAVGLSAR